MSSSFQGDIGKVEFISEGTSLSRQKAIYDSSNSTAKIKDVTLTISNNNDCNESRVHDNDQKAVFHGMKSAYRMSREYDGSEYGSKSPQFKHAANTAAHVACAYLRATDTDYDRTRSLDDIEKQHIEDDGAIKALLDWVKGDVLPDGGRGPLREDELSDALKRAWKKIDNGNHTGGARVALAAAEAYLGQEIW